MPRAKKELATWDTETDPFKHGRVPVPFCNGLRIKNDYFEFWGEDNIDQFIEFLKTTDKQLSIYAHNGGKFDFFFLLEKGIIDSELFMINGRIVKATLLNGKHEIRDSYAIIPVALAAYQKEEIDYSWFEKERREEHKNEILHYLAKDCDYLYELVEAFIDRFGSQLTIGSTAIKQLRKMHPFERQYENHDEKFRPFYFGGRVQHFEGGVLRGQFKVYDVNSMYPYVMKEYKHPVGKKHTIYTRDFPINAKGEHESDLPYFITVTGLNRGAFPVRTDRGLSFNEPRGTFNITSHEFIAALKHGLFTVEKIEQVIVLDEYITFGDYVDRFISEKIEAKKNKDKVSELFSKLLLNAAYGKTSQDSRKFKDNFIRTPDMEYPDFNDGWVLEEIHPHYELYTKPNPSDKFYDVAIGASITGAARAVLMEALATAKRPIYCDTDSIICEELGEGVPLDPFTLGAWDLEAEGDKLAIAGKKLYALFDHGKPVKMASKGARLKPSQIVELCQDRIINWCNDAPNFSVKGGIRFIERNIQKRLHN